MFWKRWFSSLGTALVAAVLLAWIPPAGAGDPPGPPGGEFTLDSTRGPVNLGDLAGNVVMLFFGFTSCPDVCPLSLAKIGACLSSLGVERAQDVRALFITLDPGRDTAERMHQYAEFFHPGIIGLTGSKEEIDGLTARYGVTYERTQSPESALGYTISHSDTILLLDRDGVLVDRVGNDEGSESLRGKVLQLLARR